MSVSSVKALRGAAFAAFCLSAGTSQPVSAQSGEPVAWTNTTNATPSGSTLQKTGGCAGCADAGAVSSRSITGGDGSAEFTPVFGARLYAGLGTNTTSNTDPALINFAFSFWPDGGWDVRESNVYKTEGRFVDGDVFRVAVEGGGVKYYKNGAVVYSSAAAVAYPLVLDTSLIGAGATLANATMTGSAPIATRVAVVVTTSTLADATFGRPYAAALQASGGNGVYTWTLSSGAVPAGLTLAPGGTISGTPAAAGSFAFVARATDAFDATNFGDRALSLAVTIPAAAVVIQTTSLPSTRVAAPFSSTLTASGGSGAYQWQVVSGGLPAGLTLDTASGTIQGSATAAGRFTAVVRAADAADAANFWDRSFTVSVLAEAPPSVYDARCTTRSPTARHARNRRCPRCRAPDTPSAIRPSALAWCASPMALFVPGRPIALTVRHRAHTPTPGAPTRVTSTPSALTARSSRSRSTARPCARRACSLRRPATAD
jgi:hypothetical protein